MSSKIASIQRLGNPIRGAKLQNNLVICNYGPAPPGRVGNIEEKRILLQDNTKEADWLCPDMTEKLMTGILSHKQYSDNLIKRGLLSCSSRLSWLNAIAILFCYKMDCSFIPWCFVQSLASQPHSL